MYYRSPLSNLNVCETWLGDFFLNTDFDSLGLRQSLRFCIFDITWRWCSAGQHISFCIVRLQIVLGPVADGVEPPMLLLHVCKVPTLHWECSEHQIEQLFGLKILGQMLYRTLQFMRITVHWDPCSYSTVMHNLFSQAPIQKNIKIFAGHIYLCLYDCILKKKKKAASAVLVTKVSLSSQKNRKSTIVSRFNSEPVKFCCGGKHFLSWGHSPFPDWLFHPLNYQMWFCLRVPVNIVHFKTRGPLLISGVDIQGHEDTEDGLLLPLTVKHMIFISHFYLLGRKLSLSFHLENGLPTLTNLPSLNPLFSSQPSLLSLLC